MTPFLDLDGFTSLWDGPPLSPTQTAKVNLLLLVASKWISDRCPTLPGVSPGPADPTAQLVVLDVVSNYLLYGKYSPLSSYHRAVGHRIDAGTLSADVARYFTDDHKMLLGIGLRSAPQSTFYCDDYDDPTRSGTPTRWSQQIDDPWIYD